MIAVIKKHMATVIAMLTGFVVAVLFAPLVLATADWYAAWNAEHNPPATLQWNSVEADRARRTAPDDADHAPP